jgi:hypothetical protein
VMLVDADGKDQLTIRLVRTGQAFDLRERP